MNRYLVTWTVLLAGSMAGCAVAPQAGKQEVQYYYGGRSSAEAATAVMGTAPAAARALPFVPDGAGPADAARIVYFDYDQSSVKPEFRKTIEAHAAFLKARRQEKVHLDGHTDERGGREYNLALGQRRAEAVRQSMLLLGARDEQVDTTSWGMEKPASAEKSEAGYQQNRRVEFSYR